MLMGKMPRAKRSCHNITAARINLHKVLFAKWWFNFSHLNARMTSFVKAFVVT